MMKYLKTALTKTVGFLREIWLLPVKLYRRVLSPLKRNPSCRFSPTCSAYAVGAVREWGIILGTGLAVWRVLRCNPFCRGGYDPVPMPPWKKNKDGSDDAQHN